METKNIDGKEYKKVNINKLTVNGEVKENISAIDIDEYGKLTIDIDLEKRDEV